MDPLQWMGAIRVQIADTNIHNISQVIHTTPVHPLTYCESKNLMFIRNIFKMFLTSNHNFQLK